MCRLRSLVVLGTKEIILDESDIDTDHSAVLKTLTTHPSE